MSAPDSKLPIKNNKSARGSGNHQFFPSLDHWKFAECFELGVVYIGEPADHITLSQKSFGAIVEDPDRKYRNRTVDLLFKSLAQFGGDKIVGVILSGSLDDGARGLAEIHSAGGLTMVLTPASMSYPGMQANAIAYDGPIDTIGNSQQLASAIMEAVSNGAKPAVALSWSNISFPYPI